MHVTGWVLLWAGVVLFCTACGYVLVTTARWLARLVRAWRYDWRSARHLVAEAQELCAHCGMPALGYARGYNGERLCHHEDRDCYHQVTIYGSMNLEDERTLSPARYLRGLDGLLSSTTTTNLARDPDDPYDPEEDAPWSFLPAPPELAHDWREQTAADLAPEALDGEREFLTTIPGTRMTIWAPSGEVEFTDPPEDPGPGGASSLGVSVPPGPDPMWEYRADHPGSLPGQVMLPVMELGPRAALVLARWQALRVERWSLVWDNEAAA